MRAKFSRVAVIASVLIIALISLTGCVFDTHNLEIEIVDGTTPYEIVSDIVMPSVAIIEILQKEAGINGEYLIVNYITGLVIDDDHLLVNKRSIPKYYFSNIQPGFKIKANIEGADGEMHVYECTDILELYRLGQAEKDIGLVILKLENDIDNTRELVPCEFADSDELVAGDNTLAVSALASDYRVFEVLIGNLQIKFEDGFATGSTPFGRGITAASMYTTGGFSHDDCDSYTGQLESDESYFEYKSSSAVLFNTDGKVVGFNYMMMVDDTDENINVVSGIGYAIKSNAIVAGLKTGGFIK